MRAIVMTVLLLVVGAAPAAAASASSSPGTMNMKAFQQEAVTIFNPSFLINPGSELNTACDRLMLVFQGLSVLVIVGGMIMKMRKDQEQMEGIASMMLKVAFIATIPFWRGYVLQTADYTADAIGYRAWSYNDPTGTPNLMGRMWDMAGQWMPQGSPQLDTLEAQSQPKSGEEEGWATRAWNWAKGVGSATMNMLDTVWQAATGALRSLFILLCCVVVAVVMLLLILLMYFAEMLRLFLYYIGCAMLPVFIAGLGVEILKQQSIKYILGLVSIACWPIGWSIANIGTTVIIHAATTWMAKLTGAAMGLTAAGAIAPPVATAAPFLAWGVIFLFIALTLAVVIWSLVGVVFAPMAISKVVTSGAQMMGGLVGTAMAGTMAAGAVAAGTAATVVTGGAAAPAAGAAAAGAAGVGKMAAGAAGAVSRAAHGAAALAGKIGGARVGSAATSLAGRMSSMAGRMAGGVQGVADAGAEGVSQSLESGAGQMMGGALRTASRVLSMGARVNPQREHDAGAQLGALVAGAAAPQVTPPANRQRRAPAWLPTPRKAP